MDPLAVTHEQMVGLEPPERARRPEPQHGVEAGRLCARAEEGDRPDRVGDEQQPPLRPPERHLAPPAAPDDRAQLERRSGKLARHDEMRDAEPPGDGGAVAVVPVEQLDDPGRLPELPDARRRARASRRRRRARRGRRPRGRARCAPPLLLDPAGGVRDLVDDPHARSELRERLLEHLVGLRAEHQQPPVEHERRARRSRRSIRLRVDAATGRGSVAGEHVLDLVGRQPDLGGERAQHLRVADVPSPRPSTRPSAGRAARRAGRGHGASSVSRSAPIVFGTTSGGGLYSSPAAGETRASARSCRAAVAREQLPRGNALRRVLGMEVERAATSTSAPNRRSAARPSAGRAAERSDVVRLQSVRTVAVCGVDVTAARARPAGRRRSRGGGSAARLAVCDEHGRRPRDAVVVRAHPERVGAGRGNGEQVAAPRLRELGARRSARRPTRSACPRRV